MISQSWFSHPELRPESQGLVAQATIASDLHTLKTTDVLPGWANHSGRDSLLGFPRVGFRPSVNH
jgi:hypothetical protein